MTILKDFVKIKEHLGLGPEVKLEIQFTHNEGFYTESTNTVMIGVRDGYDRTMLVHECIHATGLKHYQKPEYASTLEFDGYSQAMELEIFTDKETKDILLQVKTDLQQKGWHVLPAVQFGFDLAVYEQEGSHARYLVHIVRPVEQIDTVEVVRAGRIGHTVKKDILLAIPTNRSVRYLLVTGWEE